MKKKIFFVITIALVVGIGTFLWMSKRGVPRQPLLPRAADGTKDRPLLPPSFPTGQLEEQPQYALTVTPPTFPSSLPLFSTAALTSMRDEATHVAGSLGFTGAPRVFSGASTTSYQWRSERRSVFISDAPPAIALEQASDDHTVVSRQLPQLQTQVIQFLQEKKLLPTGTSLSFLSVNYLFPVDDPTQETSVPQKATLVRLRFRHTINTLPLYTGYAELPSIEAEINGAGVITKLTTLWVPTLRKTTETTPIVSAQAAVDRLFSHQGTVIHIEHTTLDPYNIAGNRFTITQTSISNISLGYYYDAKQKTISPIYVFRGKGKTDSENGDVDMTTIVSALP